MLHEAGGIGAACIATVRLLKVRPTFWIPRFSPTRWRRREAQRVWCRHEVDADHLCADATTFRCLVTEATAHLCSSLFIHAPAPRSYSSPPSFLDAPPSARRLCRGPPTLFSARFTPSCTRARSAQGQGCVLCLPLSRSLSPARMLRTPCLSPRPVTHQRPRRCIQIDANARAGLQTPSRGVEGDIDILHACQRSRRGRGCCYKWS